MIKRYCLRTLDGKYYYKESRLIFEPPGKARVKWSNSPPYIESWNSKQRAKNELNELFDNTSEQIEIVGFYVVG